VKHNYVRLWEDVKPKGIQSTLMITFSVISISLTLILGLVLDMRFSSVSRDEITRNTQKLMEQTGESLEDYLIAMRQISDAAYYNAVKEYDFSSQSQEMQKNLNLLYQANKENLRSIALYNEYGSLLAAEPVAVQKEDPDVTRQGWFEDAMQEVENMHFSTPHIQNLFRDSTFR